MPVRTVQSRPGVGLSRIGQRRQVVIPKRLFDQLHLVEGDFVEIAADRGKLILQPKKLVNPDEVLTPSEARHLRAGLEDLRAGRTKSWTKLRDELGV